MGILFPTQLCINLTIVQVLLLYEYITIPLVDSFTANIYFLLLNGIFILNNPFSFVVTDKLVDLINPFKSLLILIMIYLGRIYI